MKGVWVTKPQPFQALPLGKTFELLAENNFRIKIIHGYFTPRDLPKGMEACPELLGNEFLGRKGIR